MQPLSDATLKWLKIFVNAEPGERVWGNLDVSVPPSVEKELEPYRLDKPTVLYRGLKWLDLSDYQQDMEAWLDNGKPIPPLKVGGKLPASMLGPSSWTKDERIAKEFAEGGLGVVVKATVKPEDSLIDLTKLPPIMCKDLPPACKESEVITSSEHIQGEIVFLFQNRKPVKEIAASSLDSALDEVNSLYTKQGWTHHEGNHWRKWIGRSLYDHWVSVKGGKLHVRYIQNAFREGSFVTDIKNAGLANTEATANFKSTVCAKYELSGKSKNDLDLTDFDKVVKWMKKNMNDVGGYSEDDEENDLTSSLREETDDRIYSYMGKYEEVMKKPEIEIYRAVCLKKRDDLDLKKIGTWWSFEESGVGCYGENTANKKVIVVLTGKVSPKYIDWETGFYSFIYYGEDQWECSLKEGSPVTVIKIDGKKLDKPVKGKI